MIFIPDFHIALLNGWIPFTVYLVIFGITMFSFPKEVRLRLYDRSRWTSRQKVLTAVGKLFSLANMVLFVFSPIRFDSPAFFTGCGLWLLGAVMMVTALVNYRNTPMDVPVTRGIYRISRNPQIFSIWLIVLGTCFIIGSGLSLLLMAVSLVFLHTSVLAEEKACLEQYGESYREFMGKVPRYFLFF